MVGIVIVSHSAKLAEGVRELVDQMTQGAVSFAVAGGIDDPENPIGTDPLKVQAAIEAVYSDDGVVVLMDLGSALLSAEVALEFLTPEQRANVYLCEAPLVEGAMAAAVQAAVGAPVEQVLSEARHALEVKIAQLGTPKTKGRSGEKSEAATQTAAGTADAPTQRLTLTIPNRLGLHARPAARLVRLANQYAAEIEIVKEEKKANAKSINQVATLSARFGDEIVVTAKGADAADFLTAMEALAAENFGDADDQQKLAGEPPPPLSSLAVKATETAAGENGFLSGIAASPGVAIGPVWQYRPRLPEVEARTVDNPAAEWQRLSAAIEAARREVGAIQNQATQQVGADEASIFEAHLLFLQDPTLLDDARQRIEGDRLNAEAAWQQAIAALSETFRGLDDAYMRGRAADIEDVGQRVLRHLLDVEAPSFDFTEPSVVVAADLTPSDTARLDPQRVLAICTEVGGATAHSAILARALGIPAVVGLGPSLWQLGDGQLVGVDGELGRIWPEPPQERLETLRRKRQSWLEAQAQAKAAGHEAAVTQDGRRIEVAANVGGPNDVAIAREYGAEGVGLFRTEFLFMDRPQMPSEEEQLAAYRQAAEGLGGRPLIIRTLDIGGDKPLPYVEMGTEDNPFLGWRGIRFCLDRPEVFRPQLRAILRASVDATGQPTQVKMMFPMVGALAELIAAKAVLADVQQELREAEIPFDERMEVGIMIEVPSAVAIADQLAAEVDFFSIGTNDLTQYVMAADRGNARVADLADALQPAVLRMVKQTVEAGHAAGIWVGMCGELAGNALATPVLVGLGLDELSMSAPSIPAVKAGIRRLSLPEAQQVAGEVLGLRSAEEVAQYLQRMRK